MRGPPRPWEEAYRRQGRLYRGLRLDPLTQRFLDGHPEAKQGRWLDAGCGDGKGLAPLNARLVAPAVGADRSMWGLRRAREREGRTESLVRADARAWPFPPATFDVVRAVHLIGHLVAADRPLVMRGLRDLVRPGGVVLVGEFGQGDFRCGQGKEVEPGTFLRGQGIRTHYFDEDELVSLASEAGLLCEDVRAERFSVRYDGIDRGRERWELLLRRPDALTQPA